MDLHLVTDRGLVRGRPLIDVIRAAVAGGVSVVQLREKNSSTREFVELGKAVVAELKRFSVPVLVNDRVDVALAVGAQGVHLGQSDMPCQLARELLGPRAIIGLSVETPEQAVAAEQLDVNYLGLSPVFATTTKTGLPSQLDLEGVRQIRARSSHRLVAIGGINSGNAESVMQSGADGLAVVSAICAAEDPFDSARSLRKLLEKVRAGVEMS